MDPGFRQPRIKVNDAPFTLTRNGWGPFEVEVDIEFQDWTKLPKMNRMSHQLEFHPDGKSRVLLVAIDMPEKANKENKAKAKAKTNTIWK